MNNIKNTINKSKEKVENMKEKSKYNAIIEKAQNEKVKIFTNAGIYLYELIRKEEIIGNELSDLFEGIIELDKTIYRANLEIEKLDTQNKVLCECGNSIDADSKFCCQCGKKINQDLDVLKCEFCSTNIDIGDKFCTCCGKKILNI